MLLDKFKQESYYEYYRAKLPGYKILEDLQTRDPDKFQRVMHEWGKLK